MQNESVPRNGRKHSASRDPVRDAELDIRERPALDSPSAGDAPGGAAPGSRADDDPRDSLEDVGAAYPPHRKLRAPARSQLNAWEHIKNVVRADGEGWGAPDDPLSVECPLLWQHLTDRRFPEGKTREVASLRITATPNAVAVILYDTSIAHKLVIKAPSFREIYDQLEAILSGPNPPWEPIDFGEAAAEKKALEKAALNKKTVLTGRPI